MELIPEYMETLQGRRFKDNLRRFIDHREDQKSNGFRENLSRAIQDFQVEHHIYMVPL